jgi:hypothetical protein
MVHLSYDINLIEICRLTAPVKRTELIVITEAAFY